MEGGGVAEGFGPGRQGGVGGQLPRWVTRRAGTREGAECVGQGTRSRSPTGILVGGLVGEGEQGSVAIAVPGGTPPRAPVGNGFLLELGVEQGGQRLAQPAHVVGRRTTVGARPKATEHGPVTGDEHVLGTDRAMDHPAGVEIGQGGGAIADEKGGALGGYWPDRGQRPGPDIVRDQDRAGFGLAELHHGDHPGMVEAVEAVGFLTDRGSTIANHRALAGDGPSIGQLLDAHVAGHRSHAVARAEERTATMAGVPGRERAKASGASPRP